MLLLDSVFINNGGGKVLLDYLVKELEIRNGNVFYLGDIRCQDSFVGIPEARRLLIGGSFMKRHQFYKQHKNSFSKILCFGNVPPSIHTEAVTHTYFHNLSLINQPKNYSFKEKLIKRIKGLIINFFSKNTSTFIVQTQYVKNELLAFISDKKKRILVYPFFSLTENKGNNSKALNTFLYVSNGNTHKNHVRLLDAWAKIADKGLFPELHLTVTNNYPGLIKKIDYLKSKGLNINNHYFIDPQELYRKCEYCIYPSLIESFGLGLVEAASYGCKIIASDLPYVHEVVAPSGVFDPTDVQSIATVVYNEISEHSFKNSEIKIQNKINDLICLIS